MTKAGVSENLKIKTKYCLKLRWVILSNPKLMSGESCTTVLRNSKHANIYTHTLKLVRPFSPRGSHVGSIKPIIHSQLSNRGGSMLDSGCSWQHNRPSWSSHLQISPKWTLRYLWVCVQGLFPSRPKPERIYTDLVCCWWRRRSLLI